MARETLWCRSVQVLLVVLYLRIPHTVGQPCTDSDGKMHKEGSLYYENDEKCIINQCVNGHKVKFIDKCKADTGGDCTDSEGLHHEDGDQWWETTEKPCKRHRCHHGRIILEHTVPCPTVQPQCHYGEVTGQCCLQELHCPVKYEPLPCVHNNRTYQHNETWGDRCTVHFCNNGRVISQHPACPEPEQASCAPVEQKKSCCVEWRCSGTQFDGTCTLNSREMLCFRPSSDGDGACTKTNRTVVNHCCPVYKCFKGCRDLNGALRPHGTKWTDGCTMFSCEDGELEQKVIQCRQSENAHCRRTNPNQCCPEYDCGCEHGEHHYRDGQHWKHHCHQLHCHHGHVQTEQVQCPPPPRHDCTPQLNYGQCCPTYQCSCAARLCEGPPQGNQCKEIGKSDDQCCSIYSCDGDCRDERGRLHRNGAEWYVECRKYSCSNGAIEEILMNCPEPPHRNCHAIYLPDKCCPVYDCPPKDCTPGDTKFDGCNHCQCVEPGLWICTRRFCEEEDCVDSSGTHGHGTTWTYPNPCQVNMCGYGTIISKLTVCPPTPGPLCAPISRDGQCCPDWECAAQPCSANFSDAIWEDECNVCSCHGSVPLCTEHTCPRQCMVNGVVYHSGMEVIGDDRCDTGICVNGLIVQNTAECHRAPFDDCQLRTLELTDKEKLRQPCCPDWHCPTIPGWPSPCVPGTVHQSDTECLFCQCIVDEDDATPKPLCTKRDCTRRGCQSEKYYRDHGEIWETVNPCKRLACINGETIELQYTCNKPHQLSDMCRPIKDEDRCCPAYHCSETCQEGETWTSNCNACYCKDGIPLCTKKACPECQDGDVWQQDCNNCTCIDGTPVCTEKACIELPCNDGDEKTVDCNRCVCSRGEYMCTSHQCPNGGSDSVSQCPSSPDQLVMPSRHHHYYSHTGSATTTATACHTDTDCPPPDGATRCCGGRCTAADNKPGKCPRPVGPPLSYCHHRPGVNCHADHQCPGPYKCCRLTGCSGVCVSPDDNSVLIQ